MTFAGSLGERYDLIGELLTFGAYLGFMGVNAATIRQFYFMPQMGSRRKVFQYLVFPSLAFVFCLVNLGGLWDPREGRWSFVVGFSYAAHRTKGFRLEPVMIDFKES